VSACRRCGLKWAQKAGLCRTCERETGSDNRSIFERERDRQLKREAQIEALRVKPEPAVPRARVIDGVEYEITFDGSAR
jgi:hypothetical protein